MTPSAKCVALVKEFEGCKLHAYPDPGTGGAPWTIGWGATGPGIGPGVIWTQAQADSRLIADLARFGRGVYAVTGDTTQNRFDAICCFAYNVGLGNLMSSTLLKRHKAGLYGSAADQFAVWNRAGGKPMAGLTRRRAAEAALYRSAA